MSGGVEVVSVESEPGASRHEWRVTVVLAVAAESMTESIASVVSLLDEAGR